MSSDRTIKSNNEPVLPMSLRHLVEKVVFVPPPNIIQSNMAKLNVLWPLLLSRFGLFVYLCVSTLQYLFQVIHDILPLERKYHVQ